MAILAGIGVLIALLLADRFLDRTDARVIALGEKGSHAPLADNSIAVLPFTDMSSEQDQQYFSDGISEELLNVLAQVKDLRVAGRTSSFAFKGQNKGLREIGEILDVGYIVEGSIRKSGNKVRVTAQLIQAKDGYHQWSNTYDRDLNDIFAVQDEIAQAIVSEMSAALPALAAAKEALKPSARAVDISAYDLFLLAREKMTQDGSRDAYEDAARLLDRAIAGDPNYAPALAWRAYAEVMLSDAPGAVGATPIEKAKPAAREFADRALAADPGSAEGLFALGSHYGLFAGQREEDSIDLAIATLRKAIAVRPNFPQAENDLAYFLDRKGETGEAMKILADVLQRDPGLRDANVIYINLLVSMGRYDEAEAALARWSKISPGQQSIGASRVDLMLQRGDLAAAWRASEELNGAGAVDNSLAISRFRIRFLLGDGDWLLASDLPDRRRASGAILKGDAKRAIELVDADPVSKSGLAPGLGSYAAIHYAAGDVAGVVSYYDAEIKTPATAVVAARFCNCSLLSLTLALKDAGHKDYKGVLAAWKASLAEGRPLYGNSVQYLQQSADIAALEGDFAAAKNLYAAALDAGWRSVLFLDRNRFRILPEGADFDALRTRMKTLIDKERAALGMAPL
jgi:TolB-like protein/Tfp pilus assembly protein PilF